MGCGGCGTPEATAYNHDCKDYPGQMPESFRATRDSRLAICLDCPALRKWIKFSKMEQCGLCGCFVRLKTMVSSEKCPFGLW